MSLPDEILGLVEMEPVEDLVLAVLRSRIASVPVQSLIEDDQTFPAIIAHRGGSWGDWDGDPRFLDSGQLEVFCLAEGVEADTDAAHLSEAVRVVLRDAINKVIPGRGHLTKVELISAPKRVPDWDTATGPVQYADLPVGVVRYESIYAVEIRKPDRNRI